MKCPKCHSENPADSSFCSKCGTQIQPSPTRPAQRSGPTDANQTPGPTDANQKSGPAKNDITASHTSTLETPVEELTTGFTFASRYQIIEELGKGGMGNVYRVIDKKLKEEVALKLIKPEIASDKKTLERFSNELKLARKISHRNVGRMYELMDHEDIRFITMEYVPGEDLKSSIRRFGQLPVGKSISIAKQLCEGLAEAHRLGVIHRDLKPSNIMIDKDGNARIMDFGIARSLSTKGMTASGVMIGTPEYMSPEQVEAKEVDQRSDIYSLGIILYEMASGQVPFKGETPLSIAVKHKTEEPPDPRKLNAQIPEGLSRVILKCMEKDKEKRYQDTEELLSELSKIEQGIPTTERVVPKRKPITSKEIHVKFSLKKLLIPAFVLIILSMALLIIWRLSPENETVSQPHEITIKSKPTQSVPIKIQALKKAEDSVSLSKERADKIKLAGKVFRVLTPEISKLIKPQDIEDFDKMMGKIKVALPEEGPYRDILVEMSDKIKEGRMYQEEGKEEAAQKSYTEGRTQMRELISLVKDKEDADFAKNAVNYAKKHAEEIQASGDRNLLYRVAVNKAKDAADAYNQSDFSGAKTLYKIVEEIFLLSVQGGDDKECMEALLRYINEIRREADNINASSLAPWLYERAKENEERANSFFRNEKYMQATETYIQSVFLYEKAREKALEGKSPEK